MGISFNTNPETGVTCAEFSGEITAQVVETALRAYLEDERVTAPRRILVDVSAVEDFETSFREMAEIVSITARVFWSEAETVRIALVARDGPPRTLAELFQLLSQAEPQLTVTLHDNRKDAAVAMAIDLDSLPWARGASTAST